jgi:Domain of unknown function (DUF4372)/Transposase DDE domain
VPHGTTILGQVLKMMPSSQIALLAHEYGTGRPSRVLSRWSQFGAWVFAQLAGRQSLRDVVTSMAAQSRALAPLGLTPPKRSTLAEANERRPAMLYQTLYATLYTRCRALAPGHRFRFKSPLFSLDSTTISLCLSLFPWARFRRAKGAVKVHTLLDHRGYIPAFAVLTEGKRSDSTVARELQLPRESIVAMDRGDIDYRFLFRLTQDGVYFVTRQKVNAKCQVIGRFAVNRQQGVTTDHNVVLLGQKGTAYPTVLRRVGYRDPATGKHYVFWTNAFHLAAATIAAIYKERWPIEIVQTQMTTWGSVPFGVRGDHVPNLHLIVGDDDTIDQQFYQLSALGKGQLVQGRLHLSAKRFESLGQSRDIHLLLRLRVQLTQLLRQALLGLGHLLSFALELVTPDDLGQIDFQQAGLLPFELGEGVMQGLPSGLQGLGQPFAAVGTRQFMGDERGLGQDPAEILPDQLVQGPRRGQACRAALPLSRPQGVGPTAAAVIVVPRGQGTPHTGQLTLATADQAAAQVLMGGVVPAGHLGIAR